MFRAKRAPGILTSKFVVLAKTLSQTLITMKTNSVALVLFAGIASSTPAGKRQNGGGDGPYGPGVSVIYRKAKALAFRRLHACHP
jgi:hypothetical protein